MLMGAISLLQWEKVARFTATDEVLLYVYYQNKPNLYMFALRHAPKIQPPCLGDADRVRLRESVNSREVCHSPTWHSSESESALKRFEHVVVAKQLLDGRGTLFAPVAARRQKVFKRGIDTHASHMC